MYAMLHEKRPKNSSFNTTLLLQFGYSLIAYPPQKP